MRLGIIALALILLLAYCFALMADDGLQREKMEKVQTLYDYGLKYYHEKGSKYQGCYLMREAVKEARFLNDERATYDKIYPVYEAHCKSAGN